MIFSHFKRPIWLFFDLDDTLWDFKKNSVESLRYVYSVFPDIKATFKSFNDFYDEYHLHNDALWKDFAEGKISSGALKSERWRRSLFPNTNPLSPPNICTEIDREYLQFLAMQTNLVEGAEKILDNLSKDYMIAVLSNGFPDTQYRKLQYSGLWKYISRTIVSDEAGFQKPDPMLYKYAVNATGANGVPIMIGDNPFTDILGALRSGWKAIWFHPRKDELPFSLNSLKREGINPEFYLGSTDKLETVEYLIRSM